MSIVQNFDGGLALVDLQRLVNQSEIDVGPLDGLSVGMVAGASVNSFTFDTAVIIASPVSTLIATTEAPPRDLVRFIRGQCLILNQGGDLIAYVALDEGFLAARVVSFMQAFGWTRAQAIGVTASIKYESGFDPGLSGDSGTAYGLCQWRGERQTYFQQLQNKPVIDSTFHEQLEFIIWELSHTEHVAGALLRNTSTVADAAKVVCVNYERPKNPVADSALRVAYAEQLNARLA